MITGFASNRKFKIVSMSYYLKYIVAAVRRAITNVLELVALPICIVFSLMTIKYA